VNMCLNLVEMRSVTSEIGVEKRRKSHSGKNLSGSTSRCVG